jgi:hypothetical protein
MDRTSVEGKQALLTAVAINNYCNRLAERGEGERRRSLSREALATVGDTFRRDRKKDPGIWLLVMSLIGHALSGASKDPPRAGDAELVQLLLTDIPRSTSGRTLRGLFLLTFWIIYAHISSILAPTVAPQATIDERVTVACALHKLATGIVKEARDREARHCWAEQTWGMICNLIDCGRLDEAVGIHKRQRDVTIMYYDDRFLWVEQAKAATELYEALADVGRHSEATELLRSSIRELRSEEYLRSRKCDLGEDSDYFLKELEMILGGID